MPRRPSRHTTKFMLQVCAVFEEAAQAELRPADTALMAAKEQWRQSGRL